MNDNIIFFNNITDEDLKYVGAKGLSLGKMMQNNFPIPNGFCVTTTAFNEFIKFIYANDIFIKLLNTDISNLDNIQSLSKELRDIIISKNIENKLKNDIISALKSIDKDGFYAVRSSATAEDLPNMSFAGQQDTYLNINGLDNIVNSIKNCFASLYTERAVIYRKKNKIDEKDVSMAVVVQKIVNSSKSGIMFTANPVNNNHDQITIDAGFGLGESLVSGLITPDLYTYDKVKGKIIKITINKKDLAIYRNPLSGTTIINLNDTLKNKQVLSKFEIKILSKLGQNIENYYKCPQDIEWAIDDKDQIFILQSRPITSLYPKIENTKKERIYFSFSHVQVMTAPIKPLGIDIIKRIFPFNSDKGTYKSLMIKSAGGRVYIDITDIIKLPIANKVTKLMSENIDYLMGNALENYLLQNKVKKGLPPIKIIRDCKNQIYPLIKEGRKKAKNKIKPNAVQEVDLFIDKFISNLKSEIDNNLDIISKLNTIEKIAPTTLMEFLKNIAIYIAPGMIGYRSLISLLNKNNLDISLANKIVSGLKGNVTTEMGLKVGDLSDCIRGKNNLIKILNENPKTAHKLILNENYSDVNLCLREFLTDYGMRGPGEIDISTPRYQDDFSIISTSILNNLNTLEKNEHRKNYDNLIQESKKSEEIILKLLQDKKSKDIEKAKNCINNIRTFMCMREHGKYAIIKTLNEFRKVLLEAGDKLVNQNYINDSEDVFYLTINEIRDALINNINYKNIIKNRKDDYEIYNNLTPPRVISSNGEIFTGSYTKGNLPQKAIVGISVSSGVYEGYAKVILDPSKGVLEKGEILVTKFTDPGWTPIFINAKGLILEVGGVMTHGAIVAREYGIPALVGLENATKIIKTGDYIRINADKGYIEILNK